MKKFTAVVLCIALIFSFSACGDEGKDEQISHELSLDIENASLYGMSLGMSFEEFIRADLVARETLSADGVIQEWEYYEVDAMPDGGIDLCGYPVNILTYYKGNELYYINMNAMLEVNKPTDDYDKLDEMFAEAASTMENALMEVAGKPNIERKEAYPGNIYPKEDDMNASTEFIYFVKDGKVLEGEVPFAGASDELTQLYKETDYDYVVIYYAQKAHVSENREDKMLTDAGRFEIGIYTKEAMSDRWDRDAYFYQKFLEWVEVGSPWKPNIDTVIDHVLK